MFGSGTFDLETSGYGLLKLVISDDSITVNSGYPLDKSGTSQIQSKSGHGDSIVYDLGGNGDANESMKVFVPKGATQENPFGKWGFVWITVGGEGSTYLSSTVIDYKADGTATVDYIDTTRAKSDGYSLASTAEDLDWANPLSDSYDPTRWFQSSGESSGNSGSSSARWNCTWTGSPDDTTLSGSYLGAQQTWQLKVTAN